MDKMTDRWNWIRDLVKAEQQMEETGIVDMNIGFDNEQILNRESIRFLYGLKNDFIEASNSFNELKSSPLGRVKIYGIAKTEADFMLFRNGFKMIFSLKQPGVISIRFNFIGPSSVTSALPPLGGSLTNLMEEHLIEARKGAFNELNWTFRDQSLHKTDSLVRFYLSLFLKESAK